ncbi:hypothetical protein [Vibrio mediterranei]|uniref:hypothetical protein n=1 Tax=Vibrio mediterranei TaxID=689 RepID=UPI0040688DE6
MLKSLSIIILGMSVACCGGADEPRELSDRVLKAANSLPPHVTENILNRNVHRPELQDASLLTASGLYNALKLGLIADNMSLYDGLYCLEELSNYYEQEVRFIKRELSSSDDEYEALTIKAAVRKTPSPGIICESL